MFHPQLFLLLIARRIYFFVMSNKSFSEWGEILGEQVIAQSVLERILHHYVVVNIMGESRRLWGWWEEFFIDYEEGVIKWIK